MGKEDIAKRCIEWMDDVIAVHLDMTYGEPTDDHLQTIEEAEFIIESIKMRMGGGVDDRL